VSISSSSDGKERGKRGEREVREVGIEIGEVLDSNRGKDKAEEWDRDRSHKTIP
jgi:hypothetical protein